MTVTRLRESRLPKTSPPEHVVAGLVVSTGRGLRRTALALATSPSSAPRPPLRPSRSRLGDVGAWSSPHLHRNTSGPKGDVAPGGKYGEAVTRVGHLEKLLERMSCLSH